MPEENVDLSELGMRSRTYWALRPCLCAKAWSSASSVPAKKAL